MRCPPLLLALFAALLPAQPTPLPRDVFTLEELIESAAGQLGVHATWPAQSREIALQADLARPSDLGPRCALGRAALAWRREHPADPRIGLLMNGALGRADPVATRELATLVGVPWGTGFEIASPKDATRALLAAVREETQGCLADHLGRETRPVAARHLPFHLAWLGLDTRDEGGVMTSNLLLIAPQGPLALSIHAGPYATRATQEKVVARVAIAAIARLYPEYETPAKLGSRRLRGFRGAALTDAEGATAGDEDPATVARRLRFEPGEEAALVLASLSDTTRRLAIRWSLPNAQHRIERRVLPPRGTPRHRLSLPLSSPGEYRVELALDGAIVFDETFRVHRKLR